MEIKQTLVFNSWFSKLRDENARERISQRIARLKHGLYGDVQPVGGGVSELKIHFGQGYRVYFIRKGNDIILLLCGGDKSTQEKDIKKAKELAKEE